ncbi:MAG: NAD(P)/FAD-dependent oxidoreductase [Rhizobium sp.]|jgi:thioredoxin reductase|nr:NAD(P)/FAD-dependent oxidoreductase [Rhizobium sp.]
MYDTIIVGGSYAGQSAALQLARARRNILVIDEGIRRNRFADHSHGFLGQDGSDPADIADRARAQLMAYPTVTWLADRAESAEPLAEGFAVTGRSGARHEARSVVLATGVKDGLPDVPGLAERWGKAVFHCPYCHGYELNRGRIGVLAVSELSMHHALMLPDWGSTTFFLNGAFEPTPDQLAQLAARGVAVEHGRIRALEGSPVDVVFEDGRRVSLDGLFTATATEVSSPIAAQLGCDFADGPMGRYIRTDDMKATSVPGVFACGDAARAAGNVAIAVGDGAMAGAATHRRLMFG